MTLVKRLTAVLLAGDTTIQFTDATINNDSIIEVYTDSDAVYPTSITQVDNTLTITYDRYNSNISVAVMVINITQLDSYTTPNLSELPDVSISDPEDGQLLTYNDNKWVNLDPSSAGGDIYDTTEDVIIGKWIDGRPIKRHWYQWNSHWTNANKKTSPLSLQDLGAEFVIRIYYFDLVRKISMPVRSCGMDNNDGTGNFSIWLNDYYGSTDQNTALIYDYVPILEEV